MAHGDANELSGCACSRCSLARNFAAFRDSVPPARPAAIADQASAAAFLLWLSSQICEIVDIARGDIEVEEK